MVQATKTAKPATEKGKKAFKAVFFGKVLGSFW
jgi:hypothetical protein